MNKQIETVINQIQNIRDYAEEHNLLDSQEYLDFLDTLNQLSIDQDRAPTQKQS